MSQFLNTSGEKRLPWKADGLSNGRLSFLNTSGEIRERCNVVRHLHFGNWVVDLRADVWKFDYAVETKRRWFKLRNVHPLQHSSTSANFTNFSSYPGSLFSLTGAYSNWRKIKSLFSWRAYAATWCRKWLGLASTCHYITLRCSSPNYHQDISSYRFRSYHTISPSESQLL